MKILPVLALSLLASSALFAGPPEGSGRQPTTGLVAEEVKRLLADGVVAFGKGDYATAPRARFGRHRAPALPVVTF